MPEENSRHKKENNNEKKPGVNLRQQKRIDYKLLNSGYSATIKANVSMDKLSPVGNLSSNYLAVNVVSHDISRIIDCMIAKAISLGNLL